MTPDELAEAGRALYGPQWQTALADALGVADRTVRRWYSGEHSIPPGIRQEICDVCKAKRENLAELIARLEA